MGTIFDAMEGWSDPALRTYTESDLEARTPSSQQRIYRNLQEDKLQNSSREYFEQLLETARKSGWNPGATGLDDLEECLKTSGYIPENFSYEKKEGTQTWKIECRGITLTLDRLPGMHASAVLSLEVEGVKMQSRNHSFRNVKLMVLELLKAPEKATAELTLAYREITEKAENDNALRDRIAAIASIYLSKGYRFTLKEHAKHSDIIIHLDEMTEQKFKVALEEEQCRQLETRLKNLVSAR